MVVLDWTSLRWAVVADGRRAIEYPLLEQCLGTTIGGQRTYPSPTHNNQQTEYDVIQRGLPRPSYNLLEDKEKKIVAEGW